MTPDPVRHPQDRGGRCSARGRAARGSSRAGGRVGIFLVDQLVALVDVQHAALGAGLDRLAGELERAAELARWLAAVTRACP